MRGVTPVVLFLLLAAGCVGDPLELSVDVRTDLRPGLDFSAVRVEHGAGADPVVLPADEGDPYGAGLRVADFRGLTPGRLRVWATLLDGRGAEVVGRRVDLVLERDYALTVALSARCLGRACPGPAEPASFTECQEGRCVDPACGGSDPSGCGELACTSHLDCGALGCLAACLGGACVCVGTEDAGPGLDAGPADAGPVDAGPADAGPVDAGASCPGTCMPGQVEDETRACGACGEGLERRSRTCGSDCRHGAFSEWSACMTSAECSPGATDRERRACGNCDLGSQSRSRTCDAATCRWGAFGSWSTCSGGGGCAPGAVRTGCDPCGVEVCTASCTWGACQPAAGNECLRIRPGTTGPPGNNYRCCGTRRWQFCLDTCRWSPSCDACPSCC